MDLHFRNPVPLHFHNLVAASVFQDKISPLGNSPEAEHEEPGEGLESVVGLGRSEEWLDPPKVLVR